MQGDCVFRPLPLEHWYLHIYVVGATSVAPIGRGVCFVLPALRAKSRRIAICGVFEPAVQ
jgi:hypothetical protein